MYDDFLVSLQVYISVLYSEYLVYTFYKFTLKLNCRRAEYFNFHNWDVNLSLVLPTLIELLYQQNAEQYRPDVQSNVCKRHRL